MRIKLSVKVAFSQTLLSFQGPKLVNYLYELLINHLKQVNDQQRREVDELMVTLGSHGHQPIRLGTKVSNQQLSALEEVRHVLVARRHCCDADLQLLTRCCCHGRNENFGTRKQPKRERFTSAERKEPSTGQSTQSFVRLSTNL